MADTDRSGTDGWIKRLTAYCWRHRRNMLLSLGASLAGMGVMALMPLITKVIIDDIVVAGEGGLALWITLLIGAALVIYGLTFARRYYGGRLGIDVQHDLRTAMFRSLTRLDGRRQDQLSTGQVVGRATSDLSLIQNLLFMMPMVIGNFMLFAVSLTVMLVLSRCSPSSPSPSSPCCPGSPSAAAAPSTPPPGTPRTGPAPSPASSTGRSPASASSRASARRNRRAASSAPSAANCSPPGCAPYASPPATSPPSTPYPPSARSPCWPSAAG